MNAIAEPISAETAPLVIGQAIESGRCAVKPKAIKLAHGERIVAVVPERRCGPGWSNAPVWVYISTNDGKLRQECIQPHERTPEMHALFGVGYEVCASLLAAVPQRKSKKEQK